MNQNFYHNEFEELIREKADQYRMYPSEKVWKGINRSLYSRKKWYWSGFVLLLSVISYFAITDLITPSSPKANSSNKVISQPTQNMVDPDELNPFSADIAKDNATPARGEISHYYNLYNGREAYTGAIEIPLPLLARHTDVQQSTGALRITRPLPFSNPDRFDIELSWPVTDQSWDIQESAAQPAPLASLAAEMANEEAEEGRQHINWLQEHAALKIPVRKTNHISWQLAFSPTINYRKLTGNRNANIKSSVDNVPMALRIEGDANMLVNHKPALGFELGTHAMYSPGKNLSLKAGVQFNYSRYDITAFRSPTEQATISLNNTYGTAVSSTITNYSSIRNFGGTAVQDLRNQYFQLSMPVGLELRVLGNDHLQLNIAGTIQPTYLLNANTYLITTDYKNYTKEPSLVRKWNVNTGAEAFISYTKAGVRWQVGPQFRYQLFSSYAKEYPIKEYLMEYGIKIGVTKTIR
ncbi:MAG TPA: hypothetical protein PK339_08000 [Flavitalea sp.]|nr:hypothetical protein [Flavitalea sp.]